MRQWRRCDSSCPRINKLMVSTRQLETLGPRTQTRTVAVASGKNQRSHTGARSPKRKERDRERSRARDDNMHGRRWHTGSGGKESTIGRRRCGAPLQVKDKHSSHATKCFIDSWKIVDTSRCACKTKTPLSVSIHLFLCPRVSGARCRGVSAVVCRSSSLCEAAKILALARAGLSWTEF